MAEQVYKTIYIDVLYVREQKPWMLSYNLARSTKGDLHVSPTNIPNVNEDHNSKVGWYNHSLVPSNGLTARQRRNS